MAVVSTALVAPAVAEPVVTNQSVTLISGAEGVRSSWEVASDGGLSEVGTGGGEVLLAAESPTRLYCPWPRVPGLAVDEATYDVDDATERGSMSDAFDGGLLFTIDGEQVVAPETWDVESEGEGEGAVARALTNGPVRVGGVDTVVEYRAMRTQQVLRSMLWLTNPGEEPVTVSIGMLTNVGADEDNLVVGSSDGDTEVTDSDRWVVTSDQVETPYDPVVTHVLGGPGAVVAPPSAVTTEVFDCSTTDGIGATYAVTLPGGAQRGLMFLNELSPTNNSALEDAARFSEDPATTSELISDFTSEERSRIVNWNFGATQPPPPPAPAPAPSDNTAPTSRVTSTPTWSSTGSWDVAYEASDTGFGVRDVQLWVKRPGETEYSLAATDAGTDQLDGRFHMDGATTQGGYDFYTVAIDASGNTEAAPLVADATTIVDTTAPTVKAKMGKARPIPVVLSEPGPVSLRMKASESAATTFVIRQHGETVRRLGPTQTPAGPVVAEWNGRDAEGNKVEDGRYKLVMRATDLAGNSTVLRTPMRVTR